jgi:hypothetical protein
MVEVDAILHIGFGKTGTSSIQRYLCEHDLNGTNIVYSVLNEQGEIFVGETLRALARRGVLGYVSSTPLSASGDPVRAIKAMREQGNIPLFSQEDWSRTAEPLTYLHDVKLKVIAYVRPQVDWFNAAWWQWWRWEDLFASPADVLNLWNSYFLQWAAQLDVWKRSQLVSECTVRLHTQEDVVPDFLSILGCTDIKPTERLNQSLSPTILKLYESVPAIRRANPPEMDALLSSVIEDRRKAPWVICHDLSQRIVDATVDNNFALREYLSSDQRKSMDADQRWWSAEAYADRHYETLEQITTDELLSIVSQLSQAFLARLRRRPPCEKMAR